MAAFFPEPYPDELIFSICSRYHDRMAYTSGTSTERDLFACDRLTVSIGLPSSLGKLCNSLPLNNVYTIDRFIYQNTLYPLFSAFVPPQRAEGLRNDMIQSSGGAPHRRVGILNLKCQTQYLRFCPKCAEDDRAKWDETYWHRIHNLHGTLACPTHQVLLENSEVSTSYRANHLRYAVAEKFVPLKAHCSLNSQTPLLSKLASDFQWLLNQRDLCADPSITLQRYRQLLHAQNLASYAGTINATRLHRAFLNFYSKDLLHLLGCDLDTPFTWLRRIVQKSTNNNTQPAIHHLLLMHFLNCPVENFFSLPHQPIEPFGKGPWPCLNPASNHFRKAVVKTCQVYPSQGRVRIPHGTFACHCGFIYCRKGPELTPGSRFQFFRLEAYGPIWYATLNKLARVQGYSVKETARLLRVTPFIVRAELKRMDALKIAKAQKHAKASSRKRIINALTKRRRVEWKKAMKSNPDAGRSHLGRICGLKVYHHLLKHDREWFEANSPRRLPTYVPSIRSNWKQRDPELAIRAQQTAANMISAPGRPVRASATAIARSLGVLAVIHPRPHLLPLTIEAISKSAEGSEDYAIRRIRWCAQCYKDQNVKPTLNKLQLHGTVSSKRLKSSARIREAITAIIQTSDL